MTNEEANGQVLVVGAAPARAARVRELCAAGIEAVGTSFKELPAQLARRRPDLLLVVDGLKRASAALRAPEVALVGLPVLALASAAEPVCALCGLGARRVDPELLLAQVGQALAASSAERRRLAALRAVGAVADAVRTLPLPEALHAATLRAGEVLGGERCSVVLLREAGAVVAATRERAGAFDLPLDLARYPEIRAALERRAPVVVSDALADPLLAPVRELVERAEVRSVLVQPLIHDGEGLGALFCHARRRTEAFGPAEVELAGCVAAVLAGPVCGQRRGRAKALEHAQLESAYLERYTELVEANRRLKELLRFKDEVLGACSHDLRGPLNVLLGHGRLLAEAELGKQDAASVQAILRQGRRLVELVEDLLDRSRGDGGQLTLEPDEVDLARVCRELAAEQEIIGAERGVSIAVEVPDALELIGDRVKVRHVVQNLLDHAIAHAREGGHVRLVAQRLERPDGEIARVSISDDGPALGADQLPYLFERHGRGGSGPGLAICRELVELHGGEVFADNPPAGGVCLSFTLPADESKLPGERLHPEPRKRVLVVEDDPGIAAITAELLRSRYRVEVASDGAEALARARSFRPDLILMDVFLPRVDGLDATATLQAMPDTRDIPVILVSAHQGGADKVRALSLGAVDYLAKPFRADELLARIERAMASSSARREREPARLALGLAECEPASGLLDERSFSARLAQELSRARRYGRSLVVAAFRAKGPVAARDLPEAGLALRAGLRSSDVVGHLGEGVFAACLAGASLAEADGACGRLLLGLERAVGAEVVVALAEAGGDADAESLLRQALESAC